MRKWFSILTIFVVTLVLVPQFASAKDWYFKPSKNNQPATTEPEYDALLKKYHGVWIGDTTSKDIYLTFDCGYENGYTKKILDVLKEKKVPAAFFVTGHYITDQSELIQRMVKEGHIIGNHSWGHPDLSKISDEKYKIELEKLKQAYTEITGRTDMKYLRPPRGTFSERSLKLGEEQGYTSVFWSFAYMDWMRDEHKGADYAYNSIMKRIHPGAIVLLHSVSRDNAEALGKVIDDLKKQGYTFRSLDYLMAHKAAPSFVW
ncbi:peptidoglycan-N-acetylmuramic acid deacetylase [Pullulanibacillus pueri]|uniref:Delta-lactam-biosynthetic de-N-acetylase n=1 Tax=Pullulanibacillus pueri TaxID=1437324 RepID=A0A8J3A0M0_9BACL|nr:delta-lactam-biosynthetic de-N-acetylase [Pullulanibacillus pueri]MBM7680717.1 peptidoglycan-N-acetylmuramic acid deacetylase [Pullulanibacillus pueri]GGH87593.1 delta-lactam-biosynthetic de-N-acetylase [Pullulanibacillus pueri]